jgi:hypothetical protein
VAGCWPGARGGSQRDVGRLIGLHADEGALGTKRNGRTRRPHRHLGMDCRRCGRGPGPEDDSTGLAGVTRYSQTRLRKKLRCF